MSESHGRTTGTGSDSTVAKSRGETIFASDAPSGVKNFTSLLRYGSDASRSM